MGTGSRPGGSGGLGVRCRFGDVAAEGSREEMQQDAVECATQALGKFVLIPYYYFLYASLAT